MLKNMDYLVKIAKLINILNSIPRERKVKNKRRKFTIIACALDKKGKVLAIKKNDYNCSHPMQKYFAEKVGKPESIFLHAEIATLIASKKKVYKLLVARVDGNGKPITAKPCPICEYAINQYGVKEIEYT